MVRPRLRELGIVLERSKGGVASCAEKAAYLAGLVAVIDAQQTLLGRFPADCANAILQRSLSWYSGQEMVKTAR